MTNASTAANYAVTPQSIEEAWIKAGGPKNVAPLFVALAYQQSSFSTVAQNKKDPGPFGSVGLWQINSAAHPSYFTNGPGSLMTLGGNAAAAVALYKSDGVQPWATVDAPGGGTMQNPILTAWLAGGAKAAYQAAGLNPNGLPSGSSTSPGATAGAGTTETASVGLSGALSSLIPNSILHGTAELIMRTAEIAIGGLLLISAARIVRDALSSSERSPAPSITRAAKAIRRSRDAALGG